MSATETVRAPVFDRQGEPTDDVRVEKAMQAFVKDFGLVAALNMEACVHCGMCAEACHFFEATGEPRYTPIWKIEPFKKAYKREYGPFAPVYRMFNLKSKVNARELENWQELLFDSCSLCGRCSLICPMGIDIEGLIQQARHGMAAAGLVPQEIRAAAERQSEAGMFPAAQLARLAAERGVAIPVDRERAAVLCTLSQSELDDYPDSVVAMAKVMNHLGADWTYRSDGYESSNYGMLAGDLALQKEASLKLIQAAIACGAQSLVLPECGHGYSALRWMGADLFGKPLPFHVLHISEFLAAEVQGGRLTLNKIGKSATFHDPCQVSRLGGAIEAPRVVLDALGVELREMFPTKGTNWCCGGGGGVQDIGRAQPLRHKVFHMKMKQIDETEAELPVTSCTGCRRTFEEGSAHFKWGKSMNSLLELVADNLGEAA